MAVKNKARSQGRYQAQPIIGRSIKVKGDVFYFSSMQEAKEPIGAEFFTTKATDAADASSAGEAAA